jgi:hypothetical protein
MSRQGLLVVLAAGAIAGCTESPRAAAPASASLTELLAPVTAAVKDVCPPDTDPFCRTLTADVASFRTALQPTGVQVTGASLGEAMGFDVVDISTRDAYDCSGGRPLYSCTLKDPRTHVRVEVVPGDRDELVLEALLTWAAGDGPHDHGGFRVTRYIYVVRDGRWVFDRKEAGVQS